MMINSIQSENQHMRRNKYPAILYLIRILVFPYYTSVNKLF